MKQRGKTGRGKSNQPYALPAKNKTIVIAVDDVRPTVGLPSPKSTDRATRSVQGPGGTPYKTFDHNSIVSAGLDGAMDPSSEAGTAAGLWTSRSSVVPAMTASTTEAGTKAADGAGGSGYCARGSSANGRGLLPAGGGGAVVAAYVGAPRSSGGGAV